MIDEAFELTIDEEFSLSSEVIEQESKFPVHYHINSEKIGKNIIIYIYNTYNLLL